MNSLHEIDQAFAVTREVYARREPPGGDAWSPLDNDLVLRHRARIMVEVGRALRRIPLPIDHLRVLDVGCGVGRSSRMMIDFGVLPSNVVAIDLRDTAIASARKLNPAIDFRYIKNLSEWPSEPFDLAVQCTAFSSIPTLNARTATASKMMESVGGNGYILWWDAIRTNEFAGHDNLDPRDYFAERDILTISKVSIEPTIEQALRPLKGLRSIMAPLLRRLGYPPSHMIALLGPRR